MAAGKESSCYRHYYANPNNCFWKTLYRIGLTTGKLLPEEDYNLPDYGIGLTDLVKNESGMDKDIKGLSRKFFLVNRLNNILDKYKPVTIAFNGKGGNAVEFALGVRSLDWGLQPCLPAFPKTQLWVLPSTSSANKNTFNKYGHLWFDMAASIPKRKLPPKFI